ncbi:hypothetical protein NLI96_g6275 [Meripilus lineatus]|uniref:Aldehyde dehydrogenase domain-containing protein n=1 Tax=Meripilus lineatus TaxID=2056292 RepID=A0AAD5V373_9APHY|nr:hypothetical protein NLI96_g6275 [Physisporinus lineatus]
MITRNLIVRASRVQSLRFAHVGSRSLSSRASAILGALDIPIDTEIPGVYDGSWKGSGEILESVCPTTGEVLARVQSASPKELQDSLDKSREAYTYFRSVPAPRRGEILRQIREALAAKRDALGALISLEMGKILTEGIGEVQEFIDIADYAVGLSRMMNGRFIASERPGHSILEVLSAFNFPVAVYGWNLALSLAAGNATLWKPAPSTPLCSIATTKLIAGVLEKNGIPGAVAGLVMGGRDVGEGVVESEYVDMVSFTGSEAVGKQVGKVVQGRFGKILLELGGNNGLALLSSSDLSLAVPAVFFGSVGTAGQRCTSTRRLYLHRSIAPEFISSLQSLYANLKPGDPLDEKTLLGPLHNRAAVNIYDGAIKRLKDSGAEILCGGSSYSSSELSANGVTVNGNTGGNFVKPTISIPTRVDVKNDIWSKEVFAPILNVGVFDELEEAIEWNNGVPQGLSSSIWTRDLRNVGKWIGPSGSDTGIVNVNVGTSGAEIGAAFGGNKCLLRLFVNTPAFRAQDGVVNLEEMRGSNMYVGVPARSTSQMKLPWRKA